MNNATILSKRKYQQTITNNAHYHTNAGLNYKDVSDPACVVTFPLVSDPSVALLAWTTTPWTLPSNLGACVCVCVRVCVCVSVCVVCVWCGVVC